ncbi:T3SS effector OspC family protein [Serratia marcescens]|uniref:T3SS effector OspC family protein n=1 Tax=Serratia marcescens TaxID=615 RepID=UPI00148E669E|nr:T3SS effector OspC family protein [Serratia marcescens]QJU42276.1 T3SS effector OspC family protein [Serratia marcescens]
MHVLNTMTSSDIHLQSNVGMKTIHQNNERGNILNNIHEVKNSLASFGTKKHTDSANIIKSILRERMASKCYLTMFSEGSHFKMDKYKPSPNTGKEALACLDRISRGNIHEIIKQTRPLSKKERFLLAKIIDTDVVLRHQTNSKLSNKGTLNIFSNKKLQSLDTPPTTRALDEEIADLSNHDFVFFGVEFSDENTTHPINTKYKGWDFGANCYIVKDELKHAYVTLDHHYSGYVHFDFEHEHKEFTSQFEIANKEISNVYTTNNKNNDIAMYSSRSMKLAIGLNLIKFIRNTSDMKLKEFALSGQLSALDIDRLINFIFQPEYHMPRMISTKKFQEFRLADISLKDAIMAANLTRIDELVKDKKDVYNAIKLVLFLQKERESMTTLIAKKISSYMLDKCYFTKELRESLESDVIKIMKGNVKNNVLSKVKFFYF